MFVECGLYKHDFHPLLCLSGTLDRSSEKDHRDIKGHQVAEAVRLGEYLL